MGKRKHLDKIEEIFELSPVVQFSSIKRIINKGAGKSGYTKQVINKMVRAGKIKRLAKGVYTKHDEATLAVFGFKPAYLGLMCAASFHKLWEQETIPVIITTKKTRVGIRKVMGTNVLVRRIKPSHFFGFQTYKDGEFYLPYSDTEKTIIDICSFNKKIAQGLEIKNKVDVSKIKRYLKKYPKRTADRVMATIKGKNKKSFE